ncbi:MAG: hypothetical protein M1536_05285 [Firmicutes bacterium]|nr:hypothetical protein [Bacillota bacterium]
MTDTDSLAKKLWNFIKGRLSWHEIQAMVDEDFKIILVGKEDKVKALAKKITGNEEFQWDEGGKLSPIFLPLEAGSREKAVDSQAIVFLLDLWQVEKEDIKSHKEWLPRRISASWIFEGKHDVMRKEIVRGWFEELTLPEPVFIEEVEREEGKTFAPYIVSLSPNLQMAMAKNFPPLREEVASRLIKTTSKQNLIIALASSMPANIPVIGIIFGIFSVTGETAVLTANQVKLCLQLAAIFGRKLTFFDRMAEILPLAGGAFGWRSIAREIGGLIPGVGLVVKPTIAYSATYLTGKIACWFYEKGDKLSASEKRKIYDEAKREAKKLIDDITEKWKRKDQTR